MIFKHNIFKSIFIIILALSLISTIFACSNSSGSIGPQGPQGEQGIQGDKGNDGSDGQDGNDADGIKWYNGATLNIDGKKEPRLYFELGQTAVIHINGEEVFSIKVTQTPIQDSTLVDMSIIITNINMPSAYAANQYVYAIDAAPDTFGNPRSIPARHLQPGESLSSDYQTTTTGTLNAICFGFPPATSSGAITPYSIVNLK